MVLKCNLCVRPSGGYFKGTSACLSALHKAGRYDELLELLKADRLRFWDYQQFVVKGLIQSFEFTHELAWNVLKDYLEDKGVMGLVGSKDATREAFKNGLLEQGEDWMNMIKARNQTSHTYNTAIAEKMVRDIRKY